VYLQWVSKVPTRFDFRSNPINFDTVFTYVICSESWSQNETLKTRLLTPTVQKCTLVQLFINIHGVGSSLKYSKVIKNLVPNVHLILHTLMRNMFSETFVFFAVEMTPLK